MMQAMRVFATLLAALLATKAVANQDQGANFELSPITASQAGASEKATINEKIKAIVAEHVGVCKDIVDVQTTSGSPDKLDVQVIVKSTPAVSKLDVQNAINSKLLDNGVMKVAILADVETHLGITGLDMYSITKTDATFPDSGKSCPQGDTSGNTGGDTSGTSHVRVQTGLLMAFIAFRLQASLLG